MKIVLRILLFVAAFAYTAMPMHGAMAAGMLAAQPSVMEASPDQSMHHQSMQHQSMQNGATVTPSISACPHSGMTADKSPSGQPMMHDYHCSACLTLLPGMSFADAGTPPKAPEEPGFARSLISTPASPPERPPRFKA